jgi:phospholipid-binding lipoprotein MlaA
MIARTRKDRVLGCILAIGLLSGCATTSTPDPLDPFEGFNRGTMKFNQTMDEMLFYPIATGYETVTPPVVNDGVTNFFSNLNDISVVVNDILQFKFDRAGSNLARLVFNTTFGIGGLFDFSGTIAGLPKQPNDFGLTLAHYGVESGPYLVVPFFGPSTVRDAVGFAADAAMNPVAYLNDTALRASLMSLNYIDAKARFRATQDLLADAALDEYEFMKNAYLERRRYLIEGESDPFMDDGFDEEWME